MKRYIGIDLGTSAMKLLMDASGMLLLDVEHKRWSREMLSICGITETQMPKLFESYDCRDSR